jgi:2,3-bisphosphoglycerate-independent phosphoglycerate mutase
VWAEGRPVPDAETAVKASYENDRTPDDEEMFDEYIPPHVIDDYSGINEGDCVFHTNFRQDRAIQLTQAFIEPDYPGELKERPTVAYLGLTRYYDEFEHYLLGAMSEGGSMDHLLGEVISQKGLKQLRIAETQKFRHVTSFFNGKRTQPFEGEDQVQIKGRFDPSSFGSHPEMEAYRVTEEILKRLENNPYHFIVINFANGDMVGHTGIFEAAKKAIEVVDECVGRVVTRLLELGFDVFVTADHGNAEQMIDYETGMVKTSHTTFPVECIYISYNPDGRRLKSGGKLADIAPSVLTLMGLPVPAEMTSDSLLLD